MIEVLKKKIVVVFVWVLIVLPVHIAMASVKVVQHVDQPPQSVEISTAHQLADKYYNITKIKEK